MSTPRIVIIGGGPAGYEAALVAAEHGADVTVVSREGLGGNSVLWDCVPSKALIVSAQAMGWLHSAHRLGVRRRDNPDEELATAVRIDLGAVMDRTMSLAGNQSGDITKKVASAGARLIEGEARLAGQSTVEVTEPGGGLSELPADFVLIATGSRPRTLPFSVPDGERVFTSRELHRMRELPERLIVVGSGATGGEYAHAFTRFGSDVHLVSSRQQILPSEDPDAAEVIEGVFERDGMTIHRQRRAADMERTDAGVRVKVGEDEWIEGSHALFCIGQVPASAGMGLEDAGVRTADGGGVPVDGVSRTNLQGVYAAGDVTGRMMLASVAAMQGRNAMWHALGQAVAPLRWDAVSACIFTDPEVATVGMSAAEAAESALPVQSVSLPFTGNPRAKMEGTTDGFVKLHAMEGSGTILGATVVAAHASDLITPLSVAVMNRMSVSQVAQSFTIYPSMAGSIGEAARLLMGRDSAESGI